MSDRLQKHGAAAQAFAQVHRHNPEGGLAEDALAREAEAWANAGEPKRARRAARLYLSRYPHGHRAAWVRLQFGPAP